jgi:hypothetical protein
MMQTVDEEPLETIHLYVVREEEPRPSMLPIVFSLLALSALAVLLALFPSQQQEERLTLRLPAAFLPLKVFTASVPIIPTGIKTYPATQAHGILTLTNGSVVSQTFPKGLIFATFNGIEVITDEAVFIPAGSANGYGVAYVSAHALIGGKSGNIPAYAIDRVEGTSIYIRNFSAFRGGKDAYSVKIVTPQDRQTALDAARVSLTAQDAKIKAFLAYPCKEIVNHTLQPMTLQVSWKCQFVTYSVPSYMKVTHLKLVGNILFVDVVFVPRPHIIQFK